MGSQTHYTTGERFNEMEIATTGQLLNHTAEGVTMRCYTCGRGVTKEEHEAVCAAFNALPEDVLQDFVEHLDLIHCQGPKNEFDAKGWVVTCRQCFNEAADEVSATTTGG